MFQKEVPLFLKIPEFPIKEFNEALMQKNPSAIRSVVSIEHRLVTNLPSSTTDFTSFRKFDKSLNNDYLLLYCKLNFT